MSNVRAHTEVTAKRKTLMLVDGSGYIFRAYHALPPLSRKDGVAVGAVYGFTNMLLKLQKSQPHDAIAVVFDASRISFRQDIYADYKANRTETPEDLIPQFPLVRKATEALNIAQIEIENVEADDTLASYAVHAVRAGYDVLIVSSDKDLMQLVDDHVKLFDPMKNRVIGEAEVMEKFGVPPDKVIEVQALIGDSVDNVPGVPGIGPKTAAELIAQFGSLKEVLENTSSIKQPKRRESLIENADKARLSYELVQLKRDVALPLSLEELAPKPYDEGALAHFLSEQGFHSLIKKLGLEFDAAAVPETVAPVINGQSDVTNIAVTDLRHAVAKYCTIHDAEALQAFLKDASMRGVLAIDTETTSLNAHEAKLVGISLCSVPGKAAYIPIGHVKEGALLAEEEARAAQENLFAPKPENAQQGGQMPLALARDILRPVLENTSILKIGHNIKYDLIILNRHGFFPSPLADTMLMSYCTSAGANTQGLDALALKHFDHQMIAFKDVVGTGKKAKNFAEIDIETATNYAAEDADFTLRLYETLKYELVRQHVVTVYETIERPLIPVIQAMEEAGITVDKQKLFHISNEFAGRMATLEAEIHRLAGHTFLISSPKQLGEVLFDELAIEGGKKSAKTGAYTTDAETLEQLALQGHEIAAKVLDWRHLSKLKSTYADALPKAIQAHSGRVHTSYAMAATSTGRLASSDPNLQNIPIRSEEGKRIREAFVAAPGTKLISADYSQIELRLLAHVADIDVLKEAFKNGDDIHAITASQMFGVPLHQVDSDLRRKAKTINFGIIYGISAHGLAVRLGINRGDAANYIAAYFKQYPGIQAYMERTKEFARTHGYVETIFGRRVYFQEMNSKNPNMRAFSERAAINAPLQGSAADIIKRAMIHVHAYLKKRGDARLLLQVHDELIIEANEIVADEVAKETIQLMQQAAHLSVPLTVEAGTGEHWGEIH